MDSPVSGVMHRIPPISAFEPTSPSNASKPRNTLLWIGGLGDTFLSTKYPYTLAQKLPPSWSLAQLCLSTSGAQWGMLTLDDDAREMEAAVSYFRSLRPDGKVVIMGHSTGSQDGLYYAITKSKSGEARPAIDGVILQAGISDREGLVNEMPPHVYEDLNKMAEEMVRQGRETNFLPRKGGTEDIFGHSAVSAQRWLSLSSPDKKGQDDLFSSDASDEQIREIFGKIPHQTQLLLLLSGADKHMPPLVDKEALLRRWVKAVEEGGGRVDAQSLRVVEGASHTLNNDDESVVSELCGRVHKFLQSLDGEGTKL